MKYIEALLPDTHAHQKSGHIKGEKAFKIGLKDNAWPLGCGLIIVDQSNRTLNATHYVALIFRVQFDCASMYKGKYERSAL